MEDFTKFLKDNKVDGDKKIRGDNLRSFLISNNEVRYINDTVYMTFQGLLVYVINRRDDFQIFKKILNSLTKILSGQKKDIPSTLLSLYEDVANCKLSLPFCDFQFDESSITTLHADYKTHFSKEDWQNICLFEHHFYKNNPETLSYEDQLVEKTKSKT